MYTLVSADSFCIRHPTLVLASRVSLALWSHFPLFKTEFPDLVKN